MVKRDFLGTGWKFPIRVNANGGLSYSSAEQDIQESIWIILGTSPGERQMRPRFGCGIHDLVFSPNEPRARGVSAQHVRQALTEYEARIDLVDIRVDAAPDEPNKMLIRIDYRIRSTNAFHNLVYPFYIQEGSGG